MNGDRPTVNGERILNGVQHDLSDSASYIGQTKQVQGVKPLPSPVKNGPSIPVNGQHGPTQIPNGDHAGSVANGLDQPPPDILDLVPKDSYLPMAALISRASQTCWNGLADMVEQLAAMQVPELPLDQTKTLPNNLPNNQTKANLDKKDRLLKFANDQKADFIKLLVLLEWSKNVDDVSKTISINFWLMDRRRAYWNAISSMALLKQDSAGFQVPNPDLKVAAEVLSKGKVAKFPTLDAYILQRDLSNKQILRLLRSLNHALSVRLALADDLPPQLSKFRIHDGRATFTVPNEFELDVSILDESVDAQFRMVDFRFSFSPAPPITDALHAEIERLANSNIDRDGLHGCYLFLHELTLSYKLAQLHKQAIDLVRSQWAGHLRVEMIRRNLIIQYWTERPSSKSWIEFGIGSGRGTNHASGEEPVPCLEIKWMRHGKKVDTLLLRQDESVLCFEDILRQVIAQHSTQHLDSIFDKLVLTPLFTSGELLVEQDTSDEDPEQCSLTIQLSRGSHLQLKLDSVTGLLVISPVSERSERLQYEINRVHNVADEIVSKLLNFRCSVMEGVVLASIAGTSWETLRAFRLTQAEIKTMFGGPVIATTGSNPRPQFRGLRTQKIQVKEELSPAYFERLANYANGLISLQRNADFLRDNGEKLELASFPAFDKHYVLPELSFQLDMSKPPFAGQRRTSSGMAPSISGSVNATAVRKTIKVRFGGIDRATGRVLTIAQVQNGASQRVLKHLDKSMLDGDVTFESKNGTLTIRVQSSISEPAVPAIVDKAMDLEKSLATMEQIYRLPGLRLKTMSNPSFTITYHHDGPKELGVNINLGVGSQIPRIDFFPREVNPHIHLTSQYTRLFQAPHLPFAAKVGDFLTSLILTLPLATFLQTLQRKIGLNARPQPDPGNAEAGVRVHVLVRNATAFAVQYFTTAARVPQDIGPNSQPHLLARLEIVHHVNTSDKPMWLVRAALEDFQSYTRPSYTTPALRAKLRQEIFARSDNDSKWLALDNAAACMADRPEALLQSIHEVLCNWAKHSTDSDAASTPSIPTPNKAAKGQDSLTNGMNKPKAPGKLQMPSNAMPIGPVKQQRTPNTKGGRPVAATKGSTGSARNSEVITLD
ncbi:mediator complex subunit [Exophiala xenobiotica]|nr:mediator complex subunit [Exophiala xenobiotica]